MSKNSDDRRQRKKIKRHKILPRPIPRWKREISQAFFCRCYNWKQTRYGSPELPLPHWEATRAGPSQTWRGCAPVSGLQEGASWRRTLPRTPNPWAPCAQLHKSPLDRSLSEWQPCWDGWAPVGSPSPPPLLWLVLLVPEASGWTPEHLEAWRGLHCSQRPERIRARGRWTVRGHLLPAPGLAGSLEKQKRNGQKVRGKESSWTLERGPLSEGQILSAWLIRNRPHEPRNRSVIVSNREKRRERNGKSKPCAGCRKNRIPIAACIRLMALCWCLSVVIFPWSLPQRPTCLVFPNDFTFNPRQQTQTHKEEVSNRGWNSQQQQENLHRLASPPNQNEIQAN